LTKATIKNISLCSMAQNEKLTNRIREAFLDVPKVTEKTIFRGLTFMVDDKMCISVGDDEIMCRIDPAIHEEVITKNGCRTMKMKGREYKGYVFVSEEVLKTKKDLDYWVKLSLDFNKRAKASKKKSKK
jgi:TfoX/Sxy family transcriptional regulator of competence genes